MAAKGGGIPKPLDFEAKFLELDGHITNLAKHYSVSRDVVIYNWKPAMELKSYELEDVPSGRPAEMLIERDLDPEVWQVRGLRVNEWEMNGELQRQTRLDVVPRTNLLRAARPDGWKPPKPRPRKMVGAEAPALIIGDHQSPYHDAPMHKAVVNWIAEVKPPTIVVLGDLLDLPTVSKYVKKARYHAAVNDCVDAGYRILCDYRSASPDAELFYLAGNHEKRLGDALIREFEEGAEIHRAEEDAPVLSVPYLMRLDELGVEYRDDYPHDVLKLSGNTAVRHGDKSRGGSGATARAETRDRRYNIFIGHNHKQSITEHTAHDIDGQTSTTFGVEVGCCCQVEGGLGYAVEPDWQQGAATASFDKDGTMTPELLNWSGGKLRWRGEWWR